MTSQQWRAFIALALMWGSIYFAIKRALVGFSVGELVAWRYFMAGMIFLPVAVMRLRQLPNKWQLLPWFAVIGVLGSFLPVIITTIGQLTEPSGVAGMFATLTPVTTALFAWWWFGDRIGRNGLIGLALGLCGALAMLFTRTQSGDGLSLSAGALWFVAACILWALSAMVMRLKLAGVPSFTIAAVSMSSIIPLTLFTVFWNQGNLNPSKLFISPQAGWFWVTVALQMASLSCYNWLMVHVGAVRATSVTYILPFVALAWGWWDGETVALVQYAGLVLVLLGLWCLSRSEKT
jgi:drug/metabolite transporter (DMT)-like permease